MGVDSPTPWGFGGRMALLPIATARPFSSQAVVVNVSSTVAAVLLFRAGTTRRERGKDVAAE